MTSKSTTAKKPAEQVIKDIRRATRRHFSAEDKIRVVLDGLRGEDSIAELCRKEGIAQSLYYTWSKEFMEAGKKRLAGDTSRQANTDDVKGLRQEAAALKEVVADLMLENNPYAKGAVAGASLSDRVDPGSGAIAALSLRRGRAGEWLATCLPARDGYSSHAGTQMSLQSAPSLSRIAYCGPIAEPGKPARGGYEAANRRLIDDLRLRGVDVVEFPYPVALGAKPAKAVAYAVRFVSIGLGLIRTRRHWDLLHLTPLKRGFLYFEALLCLLAWGLGKRVLVDIRAGCFVELYRQGSPLYRALVDVLIRHADILALEGKEDWAFAQARRHGPIVYLPNYVSALGAEPPAEATDRSRAPLRLIFLGRIVPEKGIEVVIDALESLLAIGLDARLDIIGAGEARYVAELTERTKDLPVVWTGPLPPEATRARMAAAHFFVFPTRHFGEGHSNALTEAMAKGLVPVCSDHGFNRSVIGDAGRLLSLEATASDYAEVIASVWQSGAWPRLSAAAREQVARNFTGDVMVSGLIRHYESGPRRDFPASCLERSQTHRGI